MLDVLCHEVESPGQFSDFSAAANVSALREIALGDGSRSTGKLVDRTRNGFGGGDSDTETEKDDQHSQFDGVEANLVDGIICVTLFPLNDHSPSHTLNGRIRA